MTVREKMNEILQGRQNLIDCGEFRIEHRQHGFIQDQKNGEIISVYESKDGIDNSNRPVTVVHVYPNFGEFIQDFFTE